MKKIFFFITTIASLFMTACTNDEIDILQIDTSEPTKTLTLSIATSATYSPFGIEDYQNKFLNRSEPYYVGVFTYVYNEQNECVDSVKTNTKTFAQVEQTFSGLERGKYTIVTIETLVNSDYDYTSDYWNIVKSGSLSTIAIMDKTGGDVVYWDGVVGFMTKSIDVTSDIIETLSPTPIGSLVNIDYFNFDKSGYNFVSFNTKNKAEGLLLDPSLGINERFVGDYLESNTWDWRDYILDVEAKFDTHVGHTIYILEEGRSQWCFGPQVYNPNTGELSGWYEYYPYNAAYQNFENGKVYYAGIYYTGKSGIDCEVCLAETYTEYLNWYNNIDKTPVTSISFKEPYTTWGATVSSVKSYMSGYTLSSDIKESNGVFWMQYEGRDNELLYEYDFTSKTTGLDQVYVAFDENDVTIDELSNYFNNNSRYSSMSNLGDGYYGSISIDNKVGVLVYYADGLWIINYYDISAYSAPKKITKKIERKSYRKEMVWTNEKNIAVLPKHIHTKSNKITKK